VKKSAVLLLLGGAVAALAAGAIVLNKRPDRGSAPPFAVSEVVRRDIDVVAEAAGVIEPIRVVEVKSKASGEVLEVSVETGDHVAEGALLSRIDPRDVQSAYDQAAADDQAARVHLTIAQAEEKRMQKIRSQGLASPQDLEAAQQGAADARATLVRADTTLRLAKERLADVIIRAPTAGTILTRTVEPGQIIASATQNVSGGTTLFTMADLSDMQVRAKVDEVDIGQVQPGQKVHVSVDAYPGHSFEGNVAKIEPLAVVEQNVTLFAVLVRLGNTEGLLQPGMNADVSIEIASHENVIAVPNSAAVSLRDARAAADTLGVEAPHLRGANGKSADESAEPSSGERPGTPATSTTHARPAVVFVESPSGPQARLVRVGLSDWDYTEVVSGLEPGDRVVLISLAQMQKQQQEATERMRQRMSGPMGTATAQPKRGGS
jgi:HlyD family secretion protein